MQQKRIDGRNFDQSRSIKLQYDPYGYADASVLLEFGKTKVLASVTLQNNVPPFLRGQKIGWLAAEYEMLPCATHKRTTREATLHHRNYRSVEISRLIGRTLRTVADLTLLPEKTIFIDCDVLQADGGTRVASITAASLALDLAVKRWLNAKIIQTNIMKEKIAAISVGIINGNLLLDLSYQEDNQAQVDLNFILTQSDKLIEIQGTAEKAPLSWQDFELLKKMAQDGIGQIFKNCEKYSQNLNLNLNLSQINKTKQKQNNFIAKPTLFRLGNRLKKSA